MPAKARSDSSRPSSPSTTTQSMLGPPGVSTVWQWSVVGPNGSTPQRSTRGDAGSPQAVVACAVVSRWGSPSPSESAVSVACDLQTFTDLAVRAVTPAQAIKDGRVTILAGSRSALTELYRVLVYVPDAPLPLPV